MDTLLLEVAMFSRGVNLLYLLSPKLPEIMYYIMVEMEFVFKMVSVRLQSITKEL